MKATIFKGLNQITAQVVQHTPSVEPVMRALKGRQLKLVMTDLNLKLYWVDQRWQAEADGPFDAILSGSSVALGFAGLSALQGEATLDGIRIEGDMALAMHLQTLIKAIDFDPAHLCEQTLGETPTEWLGLGVRLFRRVLEGSKERLQTEVVKPLVTRDEMDVFCDDVDAFALAVERLSAKWDAKHA